MKGTPNCFSGSGWIGFLVCLLILFPGSVRGGEFEVVDVCTGDTIRAQGYGATITVKLAGIDAPEIVETAPEFSQPYAEESRDYLSDLIRGRVVEIVGYEQQRLNVFVADVYQGGESVSLQMVEAGLAEVWSEGLPEGVDPGPLLSVQEEARDAGRGIWGLGSEYVSPREWRRRERIRAACAVILFGMCGQKED